ncbi:hypothetical protein K3M67_08225 [Sphingobium sp. V4]|uniref:hypothetical protein n=1 Tax=Sphingobium sp. V4 TaxID=3038927 RepID=UPI002558160B|nr:hypothetical protein [Sphingobium sp. V4]WIW86995.1 hypothetical protein K3M67_08225 [Sphingobium sp. V4]
MACNSWRCAAKNHSAAITRLLPHSLNAIVPKSCRDVLCICAGGVLTLPAVGGMKTVFLVAALGGMIVTGCSPKQSEEPLAYIENAADAPSNEIAEADRVPANSIAEFGSDPVQRDQATGFGAWVVQVPGAIWGAAVAADERQRYAATQNSGSAALLDYEKANDRYSRVRGTALAMTVCHLRDDMWGVKVSERLGVSQRNDIGLQAARKALSPTEADTADAFSSYIALTHAQFLTGNGPAPDCANLASMPFLSTLDQFGDGEISELQSPRQ